MSFVVWQYKKKTLIRGMENMTKIIRQDIVKKVIVVGVGNFVLIKKKTTSFLETHPNKKRDPKTRNTKTRRERDMRQPNW